MIEENGQYQEIAQQNQFAANSFILAETQLEQLRDGVLNSPAKVVSQQQTQASKKIVLFALRELHVPVLMPVYKELIKLGIADVGFMAPPFKPKTGDVAEEGLREDTIGQLTKEGIPFWGHEKTQIYDCVITADVCHDRVDAWGPVVCVGHGTISKNIYFIDNPFVRRESFATVLCVPGPWYVDAFAGQVKCKIESTGFTKMDELAEDFTAFKFKLFKEIGFQNTRKTVLFVPTFNDELTSMDMLLTFWEQLDSDKYQVLIKLHGATSDEWREKYRTLAQRLQNLFYVEDPSIVPYMKVCDIVVSDLSSAYLESYVLDVPVLVGNNPQLTTCAFYNPKAVEFVARDAAYQFNNGIEFVALIQQLESGDPMAPKRREYRDRLFMDIDGKNSFRVAQIVAKVAVKEYQFSLEKQCTLNFYIPNERVDDSIIEHNLSQLHSSPVLYTHDTSITQLAGFSVIQLQEGVNPPRPCMMLTGEFKFATEIDKIWQLQQQWNAPAGIEGPLLNAKAENLYQQHQLLTTQRVSASPEELHIYFKHLYFHYVFPVEMLFRDGMVLTEQLPEALLTEWLPRLNTVDDLYLFAEQVRTLKLSVRVMGGLYGARPSDYRLH